MRVAAHLVLDDEERLARRRIHDRLEPVLDLAALLGDEAELVQLRVWAGEVRDVDRDVMAVVGRLRRRRLAEDQLLSTAELHARGDALGVGRDRGRRAHDRLVEARDPRGAAGRHRELDAGHPERHVAEPGAGGEAAQPVPPRAGDGHVLVLDRVGELGPGELRLDLGEARDQRVEVGDDEADPPAEHLRCARRQVELLLADVDPHVLGGDHEVRVAREPETLHVERGGDGLVGDLHVDVLEEQDVARVLAAPVKPLGHRLSSPISPSRSPAPRSRRRASRRA